ncbi:polysaccharide pyruvyl transferase CsaB [Priestia aryabhattai]|uniref:polysaccharide pyruvyl transferase CsaB n=1 Tax=Priestia aryabhattai TaxID=412384 RepID=UPI000B507740|nr:polysaccharide pyruvyl transferase CsaB [Priestia aryabhattai]OVE35717.1 polysaccharide pyruvyl transferase CsaB [Priestia aryabhattai]
MKNVLLFGYYGDRNLGDEALLQGILTSFKKRNPELNVTVLSKNPKETTKRFDVQSSYAPRTKKYMGNFLKEIRRTDLFVLGGGGLIQDFIGIKQLIYWVSSLLIAKSMGKKTMLYSIGVGPLSTPSSRRCAKFFLKFADVITVRDIESKELLNSIGIKKDKVIVTADPAFVLEEKEKINEQSRNFSKNQTIAISFLPYYNIVNSPQKEEELEKIFIEFINYILEEYNYNILLLPLHNLKGESHDLGAAKRILKKVDKRERVSLYEEDLTPSDALTLLEECRLMVGMRLHSLILSGVISLPFIGIDYHPKVGSFIKLVKQEKYSMKVEEVSLQLLKSQFEKLEGNITLETGNIEKEMLKLKTRSLETQEYVKKLLDK